jgi:uncharacterized protein YqhQ
LQYGGQAVVEGVMMRSPRFFAVACRRLSTGEIVVRRENVEGIMKRWQWLNKPFLRGTLALIDAMGMGMRALTYSAEIQTADEVSSGMPDPQPASSPANGAQPSAAAAQVAPSINGIAIGATMVIAFVFAIGLFWIVPTLITQGVQHAVHFQGQGYVAKTLLNVCDGIIRIAIFLGYILLVSRMEHVRRVFEYHGAEHKAINTLEAEKALTLENARQASRIHPRCGTNFIFIVLIVGIIVYAMFGRPPLYVRIPLHLLLLPVVAGISFEVLKFAGSHRDKKWAQWLVAPGLATQLLTTRPPSDDQIEVALASLLSVWDKEHELPIGPSEATDIASAVA